jgi:hypothetical protein
VSTPYRRPRYFGEAAPKFSIKDLFDAVGTHVFIMRQRIKLLF